VKRAGQQNVSDRLDGSVCAWTSDLFIDVEALVVFAYEAVTEDHLIESGVRVFVVLGNHFDA
jgi:hypothetical protein